MTGKAAGALFNQKTVENAMKGFTFPADLADKHQIVQKWVEAIRSGRLNKVKEVSLHGDFLKDIFQTALGYRSIVGAIAGSYMQNKLLPMAAVRRTGRSGYSMPRRKTRAR